MNNKVIKYHLMLSLILSIVSIGCKSKSVLQNTDIGIAISMDISTKIRLADVDNSGNIYIVDQKNRFIKHDTDFKEIYRYASNKNGLITTIDVSNPLKLVVFYDDFNQVRILDNTLTVMKELDLSHQFLDVTACGASNDGNLWIYDPIQFKLLKLNDQGRILLESNNVRDFGMAGVHVSQIKESANYVVLCDNEKGFYFFDNFGQYIYHFPAKGIRSFQFDGKLIVYYTDTGIKTFSIQKKERQLISVSIIPNTLDLMFILYNEGYYYGAYNQGILRRPATE